MDKDFHFTLTRAQKTDYSPLYMLWYNAYRCIHCLVIPLMKSDRQWYTNYHYCSKFHVPYVYWFRVVYRWLESTKEQSMGSSIKQAFYSNMCSILSPEKRTKCYKYQMYLDPPKNSADVESIIMNREIDPELLFPSFNSLFVFHTFLKWHLQIPEILLNLKFTLYRNICLVVKGSIR